jgi:hypothetical protein
MTKIKEAKVYCDVKGFTAQERTEWNVECAKHGMTRRQWILWKLRGKKAL